VPDLAQRPFLSASQGVFVGGGGGVVRGGVAVTGAGVVGAAVGVAAGCVAVAEGAEVAVGARVRGAIVNDADGDALADADGKGVGAAICCEARIAPPSNRRLTNASAAKTVNTVDQRSAGRRPADGGAGGGAAAFATSGGGSMRSVASARSGFWSIRFCDRTPRAERTPARLVGP
jgi:hypothetical protein